MGNTQVMKQQVAVQQLIDTPPVWEKPTLKVISVSFECSAYAGAM